MAKRKDGASTPYVSTATSGPRWFLYTGPHPVVGRADLIFVRGEPREVPEALAPLFEGRDDMQESEAPAAAPTERASSNDEPTEPAAP